MSENAENQFNQTCECGSETYSTSNGGFVGDSHPG